MAIVNMSYPKPRAGQMKLAAISVATNGTTATEIMVLPKWAVITGIYIIGSATATGGTVSAATLNVGTTATATEWVSGFDVYGATGEGYHPVGAAAVGSTMATPLTVDTHVYAKFTEGTGSGATAGAWTVKIEYFVTGPQETL
jgi:hypothetical protein